MAVRGSAVMTVGRAGLAAVGLGLGLCACIGSGGDPVDDVDVMAVPTSLTAIGDGLSMALPDDPTITVTIRPPGEPRDEPAGGGSCSVRPGLIRIETGISLLDIQLERWSLGCREHDFLNGTYGWFTDVSEVPDATNIQQLAPAAGPATYFEHDYTECTNECSTWLLQYVLVTPVDGGDPQHPLLALVTSDENGIDLAAWAATLTSTG